MGYTFTNGSVATATQLNQSIGPLTQAGIAKVTPVANTVTLADVRFPTPFPVSPIVLLTPQSSVAGGTLKGWSVVGLTRTGFRVACYRTNTTNSYFQWQAWLAPTPFATGQPAYADMLNQGAGGMVARTGSLPITPTTAGTPRSVSVPFPDAFTTSPSVLVSAVGTTPGEVLGTAATDITTTGFKAWLTRSTLTATTVNWIALGRM